MDVLLSPGHYAGLITDYLIVQTHLGVAALVAGFLLSLLHCAQSGNFKRFFLFAFIALAIISLIVTPRRQEDRAPLLYAYLSDTTDSFFKSILFVEQPFAPHQLSFRLRSYIQGGITDPSIKERLKNFLRGHYVPALGMAGLRIWPGDPQVINNYSPEAKTEWEGASGIKLTLLRLINDPISPWPLARESLSSWTQIPNDALDNQFLQSLIQQELSPTFYKENFMWQLSRGIIAVFPNIASAADAALAIVFPFVLLVVLLSTQLSFLTLYIQNFIWIKSWILGQTLCHYASMTMAYAQAHQAPTIFWFWEYPYYIVLGAALLCLMPAITFLLTRFPKVFLLNKDTN